MVRTDQAIPRLKDNDPVGAAVEFMGTGGVQAGQAVHLEGI